MERFYALLRDCTETVKKGENRMKRKIALLLIIALILSFIPVIVVNAADTTIVYQKIATMDELTTGKPTVSGDQITETNANGYIWDLAVDGSSVTLQDSAGKLVKPKSGNNNSIQNGTYNWAVSCTSGAFQFKGNGLDTTTLNKQNAIAAKLWQNDGKNVRKKYADF